jgi:ADP-ribose pyrophosphatase
MGNDIIASERIFTGQVFNVDRDRLPRPAGGEIIRDVVRHPGGAGGLPLFADGSVTLVRQYRHPAEKELLEIPAGRMEDGEDPAECALREIEEEIGYLAGRMEKLSEFYSTPGFCQEKLFVYLATELQPTRQSLDHDEDLRIVRLPLEEALALTHSGGIEDSKTIIALLLVQQRLGKGR